MEHNYPFNDQKKPSKFKSCSGSRDRKDSKSSQGSSSYGNVVLAVETETVTTTLQCGCVGDGSDSTHVMGVKVAMCG